jgi:hypothetical protein
MDSRNLMLMTSDCDVCVGTIHANSYRAKSQSQVGYLVHG